MTDLHARIAAALDQHKTDPYDDWTCQCQSSGTRWADHAADAVIRELGLERQDHYDPHCDYYRYVTDWIAPND